MRDVAARVDSFLPAPSAQVPAGRPAQDWVQALASGAEGPSAVAGMTDEARRRAELAALIETGWTNTPFSRCSYCGKDWNAGVGHEHGEGEMDSEAPYGFILVHEDRGGTIKFDCEKAANAVLAYVAGAVAESWAPTCTRTGQKAVGGVCPEHGGDGCLMASALLNERRRAVAYLRVLRDNHPLHRDVLEHAAINLEAALQTEWQPLRREVKL
jgi:hypothetical protein